MLNDVEALRAILFTKEDFDTITNFRDLFKEKDIEFMIEFKKIYELGLDQLTKFINKLEDEGDELDTYSILYYMEVLRNGPLGSYIPDLTKDKTKYWVKNTPDALGTLGNKNKSPQNVTIYSGQEYQLGAEVNTYNKMPGFMQTTLQDAIQITEDIFRTSLLSSSIIDNTLPLADKRPDLRYKEEVTGEFVQRSNGSYMIKDRFYYKEVDSSSQAVFDAVKEYLVDPENFRLYRDKREFSAFDSDKNASTSLNTKLNKEFIEGDNTETITLDMMGDEFDSEERRASVLKISNPIKDTEFVLNSNEGQLGNKGNDNFFN